jgi:hypothetical protein
MVLGNLTIDTTARTLDSTLGFLGLHNDFQEEVFKEIVEVMSTKEDFMSIVKNVLKLSLIASKQTFENSAKLKKVRACFLEASRLFRELLLSTVICNKLTSEL